MRLFKRLKKQSGDQFFLTLDIGTDCIKALVCENLGDKVKVLGIGKKKQNFFDMQSGLITDISAVILNCHAAIKEAENMAGVATEKMILGVSGELIRGKVSNISFVRRDSSEKMDLSELKNIIHKVQWRAFDKVRSEIAEETGYNEIDIKLVNAHIVNVEVDGYSLINPIGFQGKEIRFSIFNAFSPMEYYGMMQTIASEIDREILAIASEPYAMGRALQFSTKTKGGAIFIDVGAGSSEVSVLRKGIIEGVQMYTMGGRTFTKRLSQSLNISIKEAEKLKLLYSQDKLERQSHKVIGNALHADMEIWLAGLILALERFNSEENTLPGKIFLSGAAASLPEIREALEGREWSKNLNFPGKPKIGFADRKMIENVIDETGSSDSLADVVPLCLASLISELSSKEQVLSPLLKKVVRLM